MNPINSVATRTVTPPPPEPEPSIFERFADGVGNAWNQGAQAFGRGADAASDAAADTAARVSGGVQDVWQSVGEIANDSAAALKALPGEIADTGATVVRDTAEILRDTAQDLARPVRGAVDWTGDRLSEGRAHMNIERSVQALDGDGDRFYMRVTGEAKAKLLGGVKGQYGGDIDVTLRGTGTDASYVVGIDKEALGAFTAELPLELSSSFKGKGELGAMTADRVEMEFASADDAVRATRLLRRMAVADAAGDALALSPALGGLPAIGPTLVGGANVLGNPLGDSGGAPSALVQAAVGIDADDRAFLADSISAYETTLTGRVRGAVEANLPFLFASLGGEVRGDQSVSVVRRIELPGDAEPGELSYTVVGELRGSAKEKLGAGLDLGPLAKATFGVQNRLELGRASAEATASWEIPATGGGAFEGAPELDPAFAGLRTPNALHATVKTDLRTQLDPLDLSRGKSRRFEVGVDVDSPDRLVATLPRLIRGDFDGAVAEAGASLTSVDDRVQRSGYALQPGVKGEVLSVAGVDASVIVEAGIDDVQRIERTYGPGEAEPTTAPQQPPAAMGPEPKVVVPRDGLRLRTSPDGEVATVLRHGAFVMQESDAPRPAGESQWVRIAGTDVAGRQVEGWVDAAHLADHDATRGAMRAGGRIDPALDADGYVAVTVRRDDNLWNIAREHGVEPAEFVALNELHVIDPSLVFAGDTVYVANPEANAP